MQEAAENMKNGQVALALAGGYLLGRTHKMRWALTLAGLAAGSRLRPSGGGVGSKLLDSPEIGKLTQTMRDELLAAGKSAAVAAASHRIDSLSDLMEKRASALRAGPAAEEEAEEDTDEEPRGEEEEEETEEDEEDEGRPRKRESRQRPARKQAASGTSRSRTSGTRPARPAAEKKTGAGGRKTTSSSAGSRSGESRSSAGSGRSSRRSQG